MLTRRRFLQHSATAATSAAVVPSWLSAAATSGRPPRVLLRSSWQSVNIGDIGHTPGALSLLWKHFPEVEITLWPGSLGHGSRQLLTAGYPRLKIVEGGLGKDDKPNNALLAQAWAETDLYLSGSGSGFPAHDAEVCDTPPGDLQAEPSVDGPFAAVPSQALQPKSFARWSKDFDRWVSRTQRLDLFRHVSTGTVSRPGEDERTFRIRLADVVRSSRDAAVQKVRTKYASKLDTATEKVRRLELSLEKEQQDVSQHRVQAGLSTASTIGSAVLGAIFGRRGGMTASTIGKASTAAKGWARGSKEAEDVKRAEQNLAAARQALLDLETEITRVIEGLDGAAAVESLEPLTLAPKRGGVHVHLVALVWVYRA